jgi:hypothetical protein
MLRLQLNHYDTMFSLFMLTIQGLGVKNGAYLILCRCHYRRWWPQTKVSVAKRDSPKGLVSVEDNSPGNIVAGELIDLSCLHQPILSSTLGTVATDNDMPFALFRQYFARAFEVQPRSTVCQLHNDTHSLAFTRKWNHLHDSCSIPCLLVICAPELLRELQKRSLSLVSDENELASLEGLSDMISESAPSGRCS